MKQPIHVHSYDDTASTGKPLVFGDHFVSDAAYREVAEKTVIACVDVTLYSKEKRVIYLARRSVFPMKGPWVLGGRMFPSDQSPAHAMARQILRETGQHISIWRLIPGQVSYLRWDKTAQSDKPGSNLVVEFSCEIDEAELYRLSQGLIAAEYEPGGLEPYGRARLLAENCHPSLIDLYDRIFGNTTP